MVDINTLGNTVESSHVVVIPRSPAVVKGGRRCASQLRRPARAIRATVALANNGQGGPTTKVFVNIRMQTSGKEGDARDDISVTRQHPGEQGEEITTSTEQQQQQQQQQQQLQQQQILKQQQQQQQSSKSKTTKKTKIETNGKKARERRRKYRRKDELTIVTHNVRTASKAVKLGTLCDMWNRSIEKHGMDADIVLIQEVRRQTNGTTDCGAYRVWWMHNTSSAKKDVRGVGIAIRHKVHAALGGGIPSFVNDRIVVFNGKTGGQKLTVVGAYAPTNVSKEGVSEVFFDELQSTVRGIPSGNTFVIGGDFNARIPHTDSSVTKFTGPLVPETKVNRNGRLMLQLAKDERLVLLNSYFDKSKKAVTYPQFNQQW